MRFSTSGSIRGRPSVTPFSRARARPALTRSLMIPALEFGEVAQHLEHRLAGGGGSIQTLLMQK